MTALLQLNANKTGNRNCEPDRCALAYPRTTLRKLMRVTNRIRCALCQILRIDVVTRRQLRESRLAWDNFKAISVPIGRSVRAQAKQVEQISAA